MSYEEKREVVLENVRVMKYSGVTEDSIKLRDFTDKTAESLINTIKTDEFLDLMVNKECTGYVRVEVVLCYRANGEDICIDIVNTTSDDSSEWVSVSTKSNIVLDSIMVGRDLVNEANDNYLKSKTKDECHTLEVYYDKYYAKRVLIETIIKKLEYNGFYNVDLFGYKTPITLRGARKYDEFYTVLSVLPDNNLRTLISTFYYLSKQCGEDKTFDKLMEVASRYKYLIFKPYILINGNETPTLVLKYNRYVHLFRGYNYQCSYTVNGIGEYSSASVRIDTLRSIFGREFKDSKLAKVLYYMNLIACCSGLDVFNKLLEKDSEVIDEFMRQSTKDIFTNFDITYKDLSHMAIFSEESELTSLSEPIEILRVPESDTTDYCRVRIYDTYMISIEYFQGRPREVLFRLPSWEDGVSEDVIKECAYWEEMTIAEYKNFKSREIYDNDNVYLSLVTYAMNTCGYITNYTVTYPMGSRKDNKLRALNSKGIVPYNTLNDVDVSRIIQKR